MTQIRSNIKIISQVKKLKLLFRISGHWWINTKSFMENKLTVGIEGQVSDPETSEIMKNSYLMLNSK